MTSVEAPAIVRRKKIILLGFFGRGNAGDEAFLHAQHRLLSKEFDIVVGVDKNGARPDCYNWEPYNHSDCWSYDEFARVFDNKDIHGIHIGGGSLPFAFAGQFVMTALDAQKAVVISGVDTSMNPRSPGYEIRRQIYSRLNLIAIRNEKYLKSLHSLPNVMLGADWALGLEVRPQGPAIDVAITIREFNEVDENSLNRFRDVIRYVEGQGRRVTFVPFAPEDDALLDTMNIPAHQRDVHWHDPRAVLGRLATANYVISLGRLHTLILSLVAKRPVISVDPGIIRDGMFKPNNKNRMAAEVFGIRHYDSIQVFLDEGVDISTAEKVPHAIPVAYQQRFDAMRDKVFEAFVNHRIPTRLPREIPLKLAEQFWAEQRQGVDTLSAQYPSKESVVD